MPGNCHLTDEILVLEEIFPDVTKHQVIDPDCHVFFKTKFGASMLRLCITEKCSSLIAKAVKCNL